jgi:hypothetical protein
LKKLAFAFIFFASCTHWIAGSETRIQVINETSKTISNFSVVSETGKVNFLVPDTIKEGSKSDVYESEWVGKFNFAVFVGDDMVDLGFHRLKSSSVWVSIKEEDGKLKAVFK